VTKPTARKRKPPAQYQMHIELSDALRDRLALHMAATRLSRRAIVELALEDYLNQVSAPVKEG